jgi:hypothetical protein
MQGNVQAREEAMPPEYRVPNGQCYFSCSKVSEAELMQ